MKAVLKGCKNNELATFMSMAIGEIGIISGCSLSYHNQIVVKVHHDMVLSLSENDTYWTKIRGTTFKVRILDKDEVVEISN